MHWSTNAQYSFHRPLCSFLLLFYLDVSMLKIGRYSLSLSSSLVIWYQFPPTTVLIHLTIFLWQTNWFLYDETSKVSFHKTTYGFCLIRCLVFRWFTSEWWDKITTSEVPQRNGTECQLMVQTKKGSWAMWGLERNIICSNFFLTGKYTK